MDPEEAFTFEDVVLERGGQRILDGVSDHPLGSDHRHRRRQRLGKSTFLRLLNRFEDPTGAPSCSTGGPWTPTTFMHCAAGSVSSRNAHDAHRDHRAGTTGSQARLTDDQANALLDRVALPGVRLDAATSTLSGGEQQRVALARTLALDPQILLLDEPTSALDDRSARAVDDIIESLVADGLTVVLVTHDVDRVLDLAHSVLVLHQGRLVERGGPGDVRYLA